MCTNCGCGMPFEKHGNPANLDIYDLQRAAVSNGQTLQETVGHINETIDALVGTDHKAGVASLATGSGYRR